MVGVTLAVVAWAWAQEPPTPDAVLAALSERLERFDGLHVEFVQHEAGPLGAAPPQRAELWYLKPDLLRVDYGERTICARGDAAVVLGQGSAVTASAELPLLVGLRMLGEPNSLSGYTGQVRARDEGGWAVTWTRAEETLSVPPRLLVEVDAAGSLRVLEVETSAGQRSRVDVSQIRPARAEAIRRTACAPEAP